MKPYQFQSEGRLREFADDLGLSWRIENDEPTGCRRLVIGPDDDSNTLKIRFGPRGKVAEALDADEVLFEGGVPAVFLKMWNLNTEVIRSWKWDDVR